MAQSGYTPISLYFSTTAAAVPTSGNLVAGELAINTLDGKLYYKNSAGTVTLLASTSGASGDVVGPASSTDNALARFDLATGKLIQNSVGILSDAGALSGLTGLSTSSITNTGLTSGRVVFSTSGGLETDSAGLTFDGTNFATTGTATAAKLIPTGSSATGNGLYLPAANSVGISTNGTNAVYIDSSQNVGIGTSSPVYQTQVYGSGQTTAALTDAGNKGGSLLLNTPTVSGGDGGALLFGAGGSGAKPYAAIKGLLADGAGNTTGNLAFSTRNATADVALTERMRIDSSGNLGIGTSSPGYKLDVSGVIRSTGTSAILQFSKRSTGTGDAWGMYSQSGEYNIYDFTAGASRLVIDSSGNVGIGTSSPAAKLDVYGAAQISYSGANTYLYFESTSNFVGRATDGNLWTNVAGGQNLLFGIGASEKMRIDSSGNVGIGTSSPNANAKLHLYSSVVSNAGILRIQHSSSSYNAGLVLLNGNSTNGGNLFIDGVGGLQLIQGDNNYLVFGTNNTERARIDSSGRVFVGTTSTSLCDGNVVGIGFKTTSNGTAADGSAQFSCAGGAGLNVNRKADDGNLVNFFQDGTLEGSISVAGTTVSYNGGHLSRWAQTATAKDDTLVKGTVLSNLDEMNVYTDTDGNQVDNEQLNKVKVSDVEGDVNVAGVFVNWTHDEQHNVDEINMAMTGDMIIRIAQGTTVARGDLLMSAGDGTAKPQGDDIVRSKTVAKVTSTHVTCTYADGSYCVPCVLMAC